MFCSVRIVALLLACGQAIGADSGPPPQTSRSPIRVSSELVLVPVSVTDSLSRPVKDLSIDDFRVSEDGQPQQIANMQEPGQSPVELALLIDISGSVASRFDFEKQAGAEFIRSIAGSQRLITIFTIGPAPRRVAERSDDPQAVINALMSVRATPDSTAFYDSVSAAATYLRGVAPPYSRRVEVVISDGEDNFSLRYGLSSALRELQQADCLFYSINPARSSVSINVMSRRAQGDLRFLAEETGGEAFLPEGWSELPYLYGRIAADLRAQYLLAYYPSKAVVADGGYRRISVTIPKRPELRVRARQGYFAPTPDIDMTDGTAGGRGAAAGTESSRADSRSTASFSSSGSTAGSPAQPHSPAGE
jgi:Ca-activated chloride channel family protein